MSTHVEPAKRRKALPSPQQRMAEYTQFFRACPRLTRFYIYQYHTQLTNPNYQHGAPLNAKEAAKMALISVREHGMLQLAKDLWGIRLAYLEKLDDTDLRAFMLECFAHLAPLGHLFYDERYPDTVLKLNYSEMIKFFSEKGESLVSAELETVLVTTLEKLKTSLTHPLVSRTHFRALISVLLMTIYGYLDCVPVVQALGNALRLVQANCANAMAHVLAMVPRDDFADMLRRVESQLAIRVISIPEPAINYDNAVTIHPMYYDHPIRAYLQIVDTLFIANLRRRPLQMVTVQETGLKVAEPVSQIGTSQREQITMDTAADDSHGHPEHNEEPPERQDQPTSNSGQGSNPIQNDSNQQEEGHKDMDVENEKPDATSNDDTHDEVTHEYMLPNAADRERAATAARGDQPSDRRVLQLEDTDTDEEDAGENEDDEGSEEGGSEKRDDRDLPAPVAAATGKAETDIEAFRFDPRLLVSRRVEGVIEDAEEQLALEEFVNDAVSDEMDYMIDVAALLQIRLIATHMREVTVPKLSFSRTAPYLLTVDAKAELFGKETHVLQMRTSGWLRQSVQLVVNRDQLVRDAITQLSQLKVDDVHLLKRPLRIKFIGEQGLDEGGLKKEFFQLLIRELFDPKYGMFVYHEDTRLFWFSSTSLEAPDEYGLLGMLLGLAMYNRVILDLRFPFVVYKKLRGEDVGLEDLAEFNPGLAHGLKQLLEYDGDDVEEVFCRTFSVETEVFGAIVEHELKPGGKDIPLTSQNREEYVRLYVDWILTTSIGKQFSAFRAGFARVVSGSRIIRLLTTKDLQQIICGEENLDFDDLEHHASYDHGYSEDSKIIKWFWEIFKTFSYEDKKRLLFFTTGSDRVPVGGLSKMQFVICKQGADSDQLPTSHTCFNTLMLPEYPTKEKLERLLRKALTHAEGFGML
eukprot:m.134308 g.134308  ORF g.134308 m.134308 type:complete len:919 (-) comp15817_c0_seq1:71-2827(-)